MEMQEMGDTLPIQLCFQLHMQDRDLPETETIISCAGEWQSIKTECTVKFCGPISFVMEQYQKRSGLVRHGLEA